MGRYSINIYKAREDNFHYIFASKIRSRSIRNLGHQRVVNAIFKAMKEKCCQPRILYLTKLSFHNDGEMKTFLDKLKALWKDIFESKYMDSYKSSIVILVCSSTFCFLLKRLMYLKIQVFVFGFTRTNKK